MSVDPPAGWAQRLLRRPLVHFAVAGALLLGMRAAVQRATPAVAPRAERPPIVVSTEKARALDAVFTERWGRTPNRPEHAALVEQAVQDEILYREARLLALGYGDASVQRRLFEMMRVIGEGRPGDADETVRRAIALGLDDDIVIRRLLAEKMRLVLQQGEGGMPIRDEELASELEREGARFRQPATISLTQVFLSTDTRGADRATHDATQLLAGLRAGTLSAQRAAELGDALPLGNTLRGYSLPQVQSRFGKPFADAVFPLEVGTWSGPIESPFGLHLVLITDKRPERLPTLDEVRPALVETLRRERAKQNLARGLVRLRSLYEVRIEDSGSAERTPLDLASAR